MHAELLDPFGVVLASGELIVHDAPGIDEHTPSVAEELRGRFADVRSVLTVPDYGGPSYSIRLKSG